MKWGLWLALVGLVSMAESRSINYEFENKHGLDSEQKGTAGQVTGKYETMDHNGKVVEVKYIADHMGFRLVDELEVTEKDINSPNAEPEKEPTELMKQTAEEATNEPFDSSVNLAEQKIEPTTRTTLEAEENEGEEEEEENDESEEGSGEDNEDEETEAEETEAEETEAEETEAEETEVEVEARHEENTEASIIMEETESESIGKELKHNESEIESEAIPNEDEEKEPSEEEESKNIEAELDNNNIGIAKRKGEDSEPITLNQDEPVKEDEVQDSFTAEISVSKTLDSAVESVIPVAMKIEVISDENNNQEASAKAKSLLSVQNINSSPIASDLNYQLREILQVPTSDFSYKVLPSLPQPLQLVEEINRNSNTLEIEQEVLAKSLSSNSDSSVQSLKQKAISDELYSKVTEILQLPKFERSFVYYDNQSPDESEIRITEIDQEINESPKRMAKISSKQLNNVKPGTVRIVSQLVSQYQPNPEVVIVRMEESGALKIETQKIKKEIDVEPFNRRSSMKIESELIDGKDFSQIRKEIAVDPFSKRSSMKIESEFIDEKDVSISGEPKIEARALKIETQKIKKVIDVQPFNRRSSMKIESELIDGKDFSQQIKKEIAVDPFNRRSSMKIESELIDGKDVSISEEPKIVVREIISSDAIVQSQFIEEEPLVAFPVSPVASKITQEVSPMPVEQEMLIETEVIEDIPLPIALIQPVEQEMLIETEVIEDIPLPIALIQPQISKTHVLKKISNRKAPKQFLRSAPKPVPVLVQQMATSVHSLEKGPIVLQRISQQSTPKGMKIVEVRGAPKPISVIQVNPDTQVKVLEDEQVIYDNKNTKITAEVITDDVTSSEITSFKVRDFVRF